MTNLSKLQSEAVKQKPKELDWEKELIDRLVKDLLIESGIDWAFEDYKRIYDLVNPVIQSLLTQQRTELLDGQFEKAETEAEISSKAYDQGYLDCKKGRKKAPHDTREGYCCACDYDLACFEGKLKEVRTELLEEITDILDNIDTGMYVDDKWVSNSEELTELRKNINSLNKKDE